MHKLLFKLTLLVFFILEIFLSGSGVCIYLTLMFLVWTMQNKLNSKKNNKKGLKLNKSIYINEILYY